MIKKSFLLSTFILIASFFYAQEPLKESKNAVGIQIGSLGYGVEYARNISENFTLIFGGNFLKISDFVIDDVTLDDENFDVTTNIESQIFDVVVEYFPFKKYSFKLVGGLGYISETHINLDIAYDDEIIIGEITFTKDELGGFITDAKWSGIAPYLGIGFGRAIPKKRLGISVELGAFYLADPEVNFTARGLLTPSGEENAQLVRDTFQDAKFIPNLNLKLAYKF
ncbi:hypothetical protein KO506_13870 [Polaribacter vadi]|uniref:hypothetical protein n=1 Tax=Polaribacter TaxID=52959 RepID=UPI001C0A2733|nr:MULTISPECIES: hypothetical protein [Polaribacter]MBU3012495.1 hypothetical protein [Polaribacter vadi]MDO6742312.1 hypothetical protein [Polaribacter sp. 1_MG-2023]